MSTDPARFRRALRRLPRLMNRHHEPGPWLTLRRRADLAVDGGVLAFAAWSAGCHLTVLTSGTLWHAVSAAAAIGLLGLWAARQLDAGRTPVATKPPSTAAQEVTFWLLLTTVCSLTLLTSRPDIDDALYLNLAVSAAEHPGSPLQHFDRQHDGPRDVRTKRSTRLQATWPLFGLASLLTTLEPIWFAHLLMPLLAAASTVLVYRRLFELLVPEHWLAACCTVILYLLLDGADHRTFGNFSFLRLHQGKGILLTLFVPLLLVLALRFADTGAGWGAWCRLAATQIAAVGTSSTGLAVAPCTVLLGLLATWSSGPARRRPVLLGLTTAVPTLLLGLWTRWPLLRSRWREPGADYRLPSSNLGLLDQVDQVTGGGQHLVLPLLVLCASWLACRHPIARRLCLLGPVLTFLLFFNPLTKGLATRFLIPNDVYWRTLWLIPLPIMAALLLTAPLQWMRGRGAWLCFSLLLLTLLTVNHRTHVLRPANEVTEAISTRGLKVPPDYELARWLATSRRDRPRVISPESVSSWLPTMRSHPYPVLSRRFYARRSRFGDEIQDRRQLLALWSDHARMAVPRMIELLQRLDVDCALTALDHRSLERIERALDRLDFGPPVEHAGHVLRCRSESPAR